MKKNHPKTCKNCLKPYNAQNIRGVYCSDRCRVAFHRKKSVTVTENANILSKEEDRHNELLLELTKATDLLSRLQNERDGIKIKLNNKSKADLLLTSRKINLLKEKDRLSKLHGKIRSGGETANAGFLSGGALHEKIIYGLVGGVADGIINNAVKVYDYSAQLKNINLELAAIAKTENPISLKISAFNLELLDNRITEQLNIIANLKQESATLAESIERNKSIRELDQLKDDDGFIKANDVKHIDFSDRFNLSGAMGEFLGSLDKDRCAITLTGKQGSGKTYFSYDLIGKFLEHKFKVACFSLEEGISQLTKEKLSIYKLHNEEDFKLRETGNLNDVKQAAKKFDVVVIDSWGKLNADISEFDKLRLAFPNTIFISIFQLTSSGQMRGGTMAAFDASINIETSVKDGKRTAVCTKNRYGKTGQLYLIDERTIQIPH